MRQCYSNMFGILSGLNQVEHNGIVLKGKSGLRYTNFFSALDFLNRKGILNFNRDNILCQIARKINSGIHFECGGLNNLQKDYIRSHVP